MYYRSVNRGLSFTWPGLYAFGFILAVGMIAVATGINGLYVVLAVGLGGFIVSGLLSEKVMRSCKVTSFAATAADAHGPLKLRVRIENSSTWFNLVGVRLCVVKEPPRVRLIAGGTPALLSGHVPILIPRASATDVLVGPGLPRGLYQELVTMQLTTFPFGVLEKFRVDRLPARLVVAPAIDPDLLRRLKLQVSAAHLRRFDNEEFIGHRQFAHRDSLRQLDRKRSAGKPTSDWVVKQFRARDEARAGLVVVPAACVNRMADEAAYEALLQRARTACQVLVDAGLVPNLDLGDGLPFVGLNGALESLAAAPEFKQKHAWRQWLSDMDRDRAASADHYLILEVTASSVVAHDGHRLAS